MSSNNQNGKKSRKIFNLILKIKLSKSRNIFQYSLANINF